MTQNYNFHIIKFRIFCKAGKRNLEQVYFFSVPLQANIMEDVQFHIATTIIHKRSCLFFWTVFIPFMRL